MDDGRRVSRSDLCEGGRGRCIHNDTVFPVVCFFFLILKFGSLLSSRPQTDRSVLYNYYFILFALPSSR